MELGSSPDCTAKVHIDRPKSHAAHYFSVTHVIAAANTACKLYRSPFPRAARERNMRCQDDGLSPNPHGTNGVYFLYYSLVWGRA